MAHEPLEQEHGKQRLFPLSPATGARTVEASWNTPTGWKKNNFDFLRFFLAFLVILDHSFALTGKAAGDPLRRLSGDRAASGWLAVNCFFAISGLLIAHSFTRNPNLLAYLKKRALRIYPGFIVAGLVCGLVVAPLGSPDPTLPLRTRELVFMLAGLFTFHVGSYPYVFPHNALPGGVNGSIWTIMYEAWCYLGLACAGLLGGLERRMLWPILLLATTAVGFGFALYGIDPQIQGLGPYFFGLPVHWARLIPYFVAGTTFYVWRDVIPHDRWLALGSAVALILISKTVTHGQHIAIPIFGSYLLFWMAFHPRVHLWGWARYGDFSYGMYLYAFPIQQLLAHADPSMGPWSMVLYSFWGSLVAAALSWHLVEKQFLRLRPTSALNSAKAPADLGLSTERTHERSVPGM